MNHAQDKMGDWDGETKERIKRERDHARESGSEREKDCACAKDREIMSACIRDRECLRESERERKSKEVVALSYRTTR